MAESVVKDGSAPATFAVPDQLATGPDGKDFRATAKDYTADETCTFDATKAQEYLAKAEKELGKTSFAFEMIVDDDDQPKQVATYLQQQIQSVLPDVTITLRTEPKKQRVKDMQDGTYELGLTRWGPDYADPMTYLGMSNGTTVTITKNDASTASFILGTDAPIYLYNVNDATAPVVMQISAEQAAALTYDATDDTITTVATSSTDATVAAVYIYMN